MWTSNRRITAMGILLLGALAMSACGGGGGGESSDEADASSVVVQLNLKTAIVGRAETQPVKAVVSGTLETAVTWDVDGLPNGNETVGTISGTGNSVLYHAPALDGTHLLVATSVADASKSAAAKIVVRDSCAPEPPSAAVLNVEDYGATGDDSTDDTSAIQRAVNAMAGKGGTVRIPSGTYLVDAAADGILLRSNMTLRLDSGAILKAKPNSVSNYNILRLVGVSNVNVVGSGILQGERAQHTGTSGEQGHGLVIHNSHQVVVESLTSRDCWGDGFYVGINSTDVTLCNVVADNNRRSGISITSVDGLTILESTFKNTKGTSPQCGLNIEPNEGETVHDAQIRGCRFEDNTGTGLAVGVPCSLTNGTISSIVIDGNIAERNSRGITISRCRYTAITNNTSSGNAVDGISLGEACDQISKGANYSTVSGNTVSNNGRAGIMEVYCDGNTITSNTGSGNDEYGIHSSHSTNRHISGNAAGLPVTYTN